MNLSNIIHATTQPYSALRRELKYHNWLFITRSLAFDMQAQTQSNWCWAATSRSISHFYWQASPWTQCKIAGAELNLTTCCQSPVPDACNVSWLLSKALTRTKNFVSVTGPVSFATVRAEIDAGRPVGARIGWSGGGGHFVVIHGYTHVIGGEDWFDIDDPIYGKSHLKVSDFTNNYQSTGTWTDTDFTKSYIDFMVIIPILVNQELLQHIWEQRALLGVKAGLPVQEIERTEGRTLGLAHPVYSLGLDALHDHAAPAAQTGIRVMEFSGETPRAFYDVADAQVRQMSATGAYLQLLPRALEVVAALPAGQRQFELRLLRVPALNFEALWLHSGDEAEDKVIPLRAFHGFAPMHAIPYREAMEKLRHAAQGVSKQDESMGA
ncbi:MAG: papain-like cysteine protease family protein [Terrimicrobiaceae bacterium]|nr:papain-like cysteine protease family protein [Terrimicrobiaceae bacterium]